jgi:hypothetical protein
MNQQRSSTTNSANHRGQNNNNRQPQQRGQGTTPVQVSKPTQGRANRQKRGRPMETPLDRFLKQCKGKAFSYEGSPIADFQARRDRERLARQAKRDGIVLPEGTDLVGLTSFSDTVLPEDTLVGYTSLAYLQKCYADKFGLTSDEICSAKSYNLDNDKDELYLPDHFYDLQRYELQREEDATRAAEGSSIFVEGLDEPSTDDFSEYDQARLFEVGDWRHALNPVQPDFVIFDLDHPYPVARLH